MPITPPQLEKLLFFSTGSTNLSQTLGLYSVSFRKTWPANIIKTTEELVQQMQHCKI